MFALLKFLRSLRISWETKILDLLKTKGFTYMLWGFGLWLASPMELEYFILGIKPKLWLAHIQLMLHASKSWHLNGLFPSSEYFLTWRKNNTFHLRLDSLLSFPSSPISRCLHTMYLQCCEEREHLGIFQLRRITLKYLWPGDPWKSCREFHKPFEILSWIGVMERGSLALVIFSKWYVIPKMWRSCSPNRAWKQRDTLPGAPWHIGWHVIKSGVFFCQAFNCKVKVIAVLSGKESVMLNLLGHTAYLSRIIPFAYWLFPSSHIYRTCHFLAIKTDLWENSLFSLILC